MPSEPVAPTDGADDIAAATKLLEAADPVEFFKAMGSLARSGHGSVLTQTEYSPALAYHQPLGVIVDPEPAGRDVMFMYGRGAYPAFDQHLYAAFDDPAVAHLLASVYLAMVHGGANVALVTNHGEIIDIALVLGAFILAMADPARTFGVLGERIDLDDFMDRSNLLVSRMVMTREAFTIPAPQVLANVCRTFYSVPQTASRRRARLDPELVRASNAVMRASLEQRLAGGGQLLAMAASGSQDLTVGRHLVKRMKSSWRHLRGEEPGDAPSLHFQPLYAGTIKLMLRCRYVLPIAVSMDPAHRMCQLGGLTRVQNADDCHGVMEWIAEAHEAGTGTQTVYHRREDDLLSQVRAFRARDLKRPGAPPAG